MSPRTLTFTAANYATPQAVVVAGTADGAYEGGVAQTGAVTLSVSSADSRYDAVGVCSSNDSPCSAPIRNSGAKVSFAVADADLPSIVVVNADALATSVSEALATPLSYTVRLGSQPAADVVVTASSASPSVAYVVSTLTFTAANWNTPQAFSLTVVDDSVAQGTHAAVLSHSSASTDTDYVIGTGAGPAATLTITDNDVAGLVVSSPSAGLVSESAGTTVVTVRLTSQPTAPVVVSVAWTPANGASIVAASAPGLSDRLFLTIQPDAWNTAVPITFTTTYNPANTGNVAVSATFSFSSSDTAYVQSATRTFTVVDDDGAGIVPGLAFGLALAEGATKTYAVTLQRQITSDVTVGITVAAPAGSAYPVPFTVQPATLTFTSGTATVPQSVTITSASDDIAYPASLLFSVVHRVTAAAGEPLYAAADPVTITIGVADADVAGVAVSSPADKTLNLTSASSSTFAVRLTSQPVAAVTVALAASAGSLTVSPAQLTFAAGASDWATPKTVTVTRSGTTPAGASSVATVSVSGGAYATNVETVTVLLPAPVAVFPSASPSPLPAGASPSSSALPAEDTKVTLSLSFSGVSASTLSTSAARTQFAAQVRANLPNGGSGTTVVVSRVEDVSVTPAVVVYSAARRLVATLRVVVVVVAADRAAATSIGAAISANTATFGTALVASLANVNAAFTGATVAVAAPVYAGSAVTPADSSSDLSEGGKAGIAIAVIVLAIAAAYAYFHFKGVAEAKAKEEAEKAAQKEQPAFEAANPMAAARAQAATDGSSRAVGSAPVKIRKAEVAPSATGDSTTAAAPAVADTTATGV